MTNVNDVSPNMFSDIFGLANQTKQQDTGTPKFGSEVQNSDIFKKQEEPKEEDKNPDGSEKPKEGAENQQVEADILLGKKKEEETEAGKNELKDISEYFSDRMKAGKFVKITDENNNEFVPKTPEEFDEVLELQVKYKVEEELKKSENKWYEEKSPAWQFISKYAEMVDNPADLIPFLQGVQQIQSVAQLNEEEIDDAERIVRARLERRGESDTLIDQQIEALKTTDGLIKAAKECKPLIIKEEQQELAKRIQEEKQRDEQFRNMINTFSEKAIDAMEQPIFGTHKLKLEEKKVVYDLVGMPQKETQGYKIYSAIDELFDKQDFAKLTKIALLLGKEDSFYSYLDSTAANRTATSLEKKLRLSTESRSAGRDGGLDKDDTPVIQRTTFPKNPRFGR